MIYPHLFVILPNVLTSATKKFVLYTTYSDNVYTLNDWICSLVVYHLQWRMAVLSGGAEFVVMTQGFTPIANTALSNGRNLLLTGQWRLHFSYNCPLSFSTPYCNLFQTKILQRFVLFVGPWQKNPLVKYYLDFSIVFGSLPTEKGFFGLMNYAKMRTWDLMCDC